MPIAKVVSDAIREAGGKVFLAHLYLYPLKDHIAYLDKIVSENIIDGIEVYHSKHTLEETKISASLSEQTIEATIGINDTNIDLKLYANANLHDSTNTYTANINIGKLNLSDFGILKTEKDTNIMLSTQITANIEGNEFDDLCGNILL